MDVRVDVVGDSGGVDCYSSLVVVVVVDVLVVVVVDDVDGVGLGGDRDG